MTPDRTPTDTAAIAERWVEELEQHFRGDPPPFIRDQYDTPHLVKREEDES